MSNVIISTKIFDFDFDIVNVSSPNPFPTPSHTPCFSVWFIYILVQQFSLLLHEGESVLRYNDDPFLNLLLWLQITTESSTLIDHVFFFFFLFFFFFFFFLFTYADHRIHIWSCIRIMGKDRVKFDPHPSPFPHLPPAPVVFPSEHSIARRPFCVLDVCVSVFSFGPLCPVVICSSSSLSIHRKCCVSWFLHFWDNIIYTFFV